MVCPKGLGVGPCKSCVAEGDPCQKKSKGGVNLALTSSISLGRKVGRLEGEEMGGTEWCKVKGKNSKRKSIQTRISQINTV